VVDINAIKQAYVLLQARIEEIDGSVALRGDLKRWVDSWTIHLHFVLFYVPGGFEGKSVLDFGCGSALLAPILFGLGAAKYVGADVLDHLPEIASLHNANAHRMDFIRIRDGYVDAQPDSVDVLMANEVISHVQPRDLPTVYQECARIVRPGGVLFISDGNSLDAAEYVDGVLAELHDAIENGPDGRWYGTPPTNYIGCCYMRHRRDLIAEWFPQLNEDQLTFLAKNTSGLWGTFLRREVETFVDTGKLVRRPYRKGTAPCSPDNGVVQERPFYPHQVMLELRALGFDCVCSDVTPRAPAAWSGDLLARSFPAGNFQIAATKR